MGNSSDNSTALNVVNWDTTKNRISYTSGIFDLRGGGSYLVECIQGKSSVHSTRSLVSLLSVVEPIDGSALLTASPPLTSCLSNSLSTEKLIGNPGVRDKFDGLSPFCSGLDISDSTLKDMPLAVAGLLSSIALWVDRSSIFFSTKGFFVCVSSLECLVALPSVALVRNWREPAVNSHFTRLTSANIGPCLIGHKIIVSLSSKFVVDKWQPTTGRAGCHL